MNLHDYDIRYEALQEGLQKGEEIGAQKKAEEAAKNLYSNGVSIELIAQSLHMTENQVRELVKTIPVKVE